MSQVRDFHQSLFCVPVRLSRVHFTRPRFIIACVFQGLVLERLVSQVRNFYFSTIYNSSISMVREFSSLLYTSLRFTSSRFLLAHVLQVHVLLVQSIPSSLVQLSRNHVISEKVRESFAFDFSYAICTRS